jgi:hypothetical protein
MRLAMLIALALLTACKPSIVREPYPVDVVREVVKPIPATYTDPLPTPTLPKDITVKDLVLHIKEWQAFGETANEHRGKVRELSRGDE